MNTFDDQTIKTYLLLERQRFVTAGLLSELHAEIPLVRSISVRVWNELLKRLKVTSIQKDLGQPKPVDISLQVCLGGLINSWIGGGRVTVRFVPAAEDEQGETYDSECYIQHQKLYGGKIIISLYSGKGNVQSRFLDLFAHELTHLYDTFGRLKVGRLEDSGNYRYITQDLQKSKNENLERYGNLEYGLDSAEQKALLGQVKTELREFFRGQEKNIYSDEKCTEAIKSIPVWKKIKGWEADLNELLKLKDYLLDHPDLVQPVAGPICQAHLFLYGKNSPLSRILSRLQNRLYDFKDRYKRVAAKSCYDLRSEIYKEMPDRHIFSEYLDSLL